MPAEYLLLERPAKKSLRKLPIHVHKKIITALDDLLKNPLIGAKLHGELADYYKVRVGDYRIVYRFDKKQSIVTVVKIEHRQGAYK